MSKYFVTAFLLVVIGSVLSNAYKTTHMRDNSDLLRAKRETETEPKGVVIDGKDAEDGTNQGLIATYWNNFLKRARLPLPILNITNPLSNILTPYSVTIDYPPEDTPQKVEWNNVQQQLILVDPATQQYYKVQPVPS